MLRYSNVDIVFREIPDQTTLAINLTGCPNRCKGCHSPHLQQNGGEPLTEEILLGWLNRYNPLITCICFMGGDQAPFEVNQLAQFLKQQAPTLHIGWYSGQPTLPSHFSVEPFTYIKLGPWIEHLGGLTSKITNQRLYKVDQGTLIDVTACLLT